MPKGLEHILQYKHNKKFLKFLEQDNKYADWIITGYFYCAIHLVEKVLDEKYSTHTTKHVIRDDFIYRYPEFKQIATDYITLKSESVKSRYNCFYINTNTSTQNAINTVHKCLDNIEQKLS